MRVRGWCPGVHEPMLSGDGLLVRVKPPGGRLPPAALHALADAVEAHGNGVVELTSRGNLQVRGLTDASAPHFAAAMIAVGLADVDPHRERRRNVIVMPPYRDALAAEVEAVLMQTEGLAAKFCVAVGQAEADIVITPDLVLMAGDEQVPYTADALRGMLATAAGQRLKRSGSPGTPPGHDLMILPFGQTNPDTLRRLAETSGVRTTPYRAFHVPGYGDCQPASGIAACPGAPACSGGSTPTRDDARFLVGQGIKNVHVSGCGKGCAYPYAGRTLVARGGYYDLVRHGRAGDRPDITGLTIAQAAVLLA